LGKAVGEHRYLFLAQMSYGVKKYYCRLE
jgi:hypothetical protein